MMDTVVVGIDTAWRGSGALDWALHEATSRRIPLRAVHVVDERMNRGYAAPLSVGGQLVLATPVTAVQTELIDEVEEHLRSADPTLDLRADVLVGPPDRRLTELTAEARLTVVGRRGAGGFARAFIGSVSEYVATHGTGPVVVVPATWRWAQHTNAPVVVGVDEHERSEQGLTFAFEFAAAHDAPVWLVHAWGTPSLYNYDETTIRDIGDAWKALARRRLDAVTRQWREKFPEVTIESSLQESHAVEALLDTAQLTDAQLIVVGGRHRRMPGMILGSVARGVLRHAETPVAVVHELRH